jgi:predicted molibdopterin-dependent oxidoreductase YjgC
MTWRRSAKPQPSSTKFVVPATDAPNVLGARDLGLAVGAGLDGAADLSALRSAVDGGHVDVLYVVDPGPAESIGDIAWVIEARQAGRLKALVYQGVLSGPLAAAADVVLPGAAWVEKDGCFTNDQGRVQAASKALVTPGEAVEDWQILTSVAAALGLSFTYQSPAAVRADLAAALAAQPAYVGLGAQTFNRPVSAETWLQASNPSERWKWDVMYQDLPPVKGHNVQMEHAAKPSVIPLRLVTELGPAGD